MPGLEGRAGMAAIYDPEGVLDMNRLALDIKEQLPVYARPQFIRILTKLDLTGKNLKFDLDFIKNVFFFSRKCLTYFQNCFHNLLNSLDISFQKKLSSDVFQILEKCWILICFS